MTKEEFLRLMRFPEEWVTLDMYTDELFLWQRQSYKPGHEEAAEHDRNGAFHWWLRREPSTYQLKALLKLASLDPDAGLRDDVCQYIRSSRHYDDDVAAWDNDLFGS